MPGEFEFKKDAINRRAFLRETSMGVASIGLLSSVPTVGSAQQSPKSNDLFGVQMGVAYPHKVPAENWAAMEEKRRIGYNIAEFCGFNGNDPAELRKHAESIGLTLHSIHIGWDQVRAFTASGQRGDPTLGGAAEVTNVVYTPDAIVQLARVDLPKVRDMGAGYAVLGGARLANFESTDSIRRLCDAYNTSNDIARKLGLNLGYHNHPHDFIPVGGRFPYEMITEETDPTFKLQIDVGWVVVSGQDPVALIKKYQNRVFSYHLKDVRKDKTFSEWGDGTGTIDWAALRAASQQTEQPLYYIEGGDPVKAYQFLKTYGWRTDV